MLWGAQVAGWRGRGLEEPWRKLISYRSAFYLLAGGCQPKLKTQTTAKGSPCNVISEGFKETGDVSETKGLDRALLYALLFGPQQLEMVFL